MSRIRVGAAYASCALAAYWLGARAQPTPSAPRPRVITERVVVPAPAPGGLGRDDVRAMIEASRGRDTQPPTEPPNADPAPAPAEQDAAATRARARITAGLGDGVWDLADRVALRAELAQLDDAHLHDVLAPLFQALNAQRARVDGPPI